MGGFFISSLIFYGDLLDATLLSRYLSVCLFLLFTLLWHLKEKNFFWHWGKFQCLFLLFITLHLLSSFWAPAPSEAWLESFRLVLQILVFSFTTFYLHKYPGFEKNLVKTMFLVLSIYLGYGYLQLFQLHSLNTQELYTIHSFSGHKNLFSSFLFLGGSLSLYGILNFQRRERYFMAVVLILSLILLLLLQTRAVWLATATATFTALVVFAVTSATRPQETIKKYKKIILLIFLSGLLFFLLLHHFNPAIVQRMNFLEYAVTPSGAERLVLWKKTLQLIKNNLWLGVGAGNWQLMYPSVSLEGLYNAEYDYLTFQRPHNDFLWIMSESGMVGILIYLVLQLLLIFPLAGKMKAAKIPSERFSICILIAAFMGYHVISIFDFPKERIEHTLLFTFLMAFLYHKSGPKKRYISNHKANLMLNSVFLIILVIGIFLAFLRCSGEINTKAVYKYRSRNHWEKVIHHCDQATSLFYNIDPTSIPIHWYRGIAHFSLGKYVEAKGDFLHAAKTAPYNHFVLNNLGSVYQVLGDIESAKYNYIKAIKISPHYDDAILNLGALYYNEGNFQEALQWVSSASDRSVRKQQYLLFIKKKMRNGLKK